MNKRGTAPAGCLIFSQPWPVRSRDGGMGHRFNGPSTSGATGTSVRDGCTRRTGQFAAQTAEKPFSRNKVEPTRRLRAHLEQKTTTSETPLHRYTEDAQRCTEILRTAQPQMTRQTAGPHPISYAIWLEHVSGHNPGLSEALLERTRGGRLLDETATNQLYREHIADAGELRSDTAAEAIRRVMNAIAESAREAGAKTSRHGAWLGRLREQTNDDTIEGRVLRELLEQTADMQQAVSGLNKRLASSQQEFDIL